MTHFRTLTLTSVLALAAAPAFADLTADQVLDDFLRQVEAGGFETEVAGRLRSGDRVTISGVTFSGDIEDGSMSITLGGAEFVELGDGTVRIDYPEELPVDVAFTDGEESFAASAMLTHTGLTYLASGSPERIRYDYTADSMVLSDLTITEPAEAAEFPFDIAFTMSGMTGMTEIGDGTVRDYDASLSVASTAFTFGFADPDGEDGEVSFQLGIADLALAMSGAAAPVGLEASAAETIEAGNRAKGSLTHGNLSYAFAATGPDGPINMSTTAASGAADFDFGENGLSYGASATDTTVSMFGGAIPLPVNLAFAETSMRFQMPLLPSEEEQDFTLALKLAGLTLDDMIWGMFDPMEQLPRDPATVALDFTGKIILSEDFTASDYGADPMAMDEMPGTVESLTLNELEVSLAGASLTGNGDFTFNNEMGMPLPSGLANFRLTGANALMDTLVAMGLLPEEQAMGARMMLSMFARPDGEDELTSTIEVNEDGSILANGQRIK